MIGICVHESSDNLVDNLANCSTICQIFVLPPPPPPPPKRPVIPTKRLRHSREGGNPHPSFPRMRAIPKPTETPHSHTGLLRHSTIPAHPAHQPVIPTGGKPQRHSRKGGNPFIPFPQKPTPSFPRRRESTIPAHAGIQRKHHPNQPDTSFPHRTTSTSFPQSAGIQTHQCHFGHWGHRINSRVRGNCGFPTPGMTFPRNAGIHNSRACGNSTENTIQT